MVEAGKVFRDGATVYCYFFMIKVVFIRYKELELAHVSACACSCIASAKH